MFILTVALTCSDSQQEQDYWKVLRNSNKEKLGGGLCNLKTIYSLPFLYIEICCFGWMLSKWLDYQLLFIVSVLSKGKKCTLFISSLMGKILLVDSLLFLLLQRTVSFHSEAALLSPEKQLYSTILNIYISNILQD